MRACFVPFRYPGQYEDEGTGLYYNRFRYYSPQMGMYISSDPIGLAGNNPTLYGYVFNSNIEVDLWGLKCKRIVLGEGMDRVKDAARKNNARWYQAWSKNFPKGRPMTPDELSKALARNARWLKTKIKEGYEIIDIGIDPNRSNRSPFYALEQKILKDKNVTVLRL